MDCLIALFSILRYSSFTLALLGRRCHTEMAQTFSFGVLCFNAAYCALLLLCLMLCQLVSCQFRIVALLVRHLFIYCCNFIHMSCVPACGTLYMSP